MAGENHCPLASICTPWGSYPCVYMHIWEGMGGDKRERQVVSIHTKLLSQKLRAVPTQLFFFHPVTLQVLQVYLQMEERKRKQKSLEALPLWPATLPIFHAVTSHESFLGLSFLVWILFSIPEATKLTQYQALCWDQE